MTSAAFTFAGEGAMPRGMSRGLAIRIPLATLLSPPAAAFFVAILLSGWFAAEQPGGPAPGPGGALGRFFYGVEAFTLLGTIFVGPFTIAFALLTQLPLLWAYRRFGRPPLPAHLLVSAALGVPLFLTLFPSMLSGGAWGIGFPSPASAETLAMPVAMGATGGAAVGLVWHLLVLKGLSRRGASNDAA